MSRPENADGDRTEHLEFQCHHDEATVDTHQTTQSIRRRNSIESVTSNASRATSIVSARRSIKSLPREIELEEDGDDSQSHESLEEEAFDNRSLVSGVFRSNYCDPGGQSLQIPKYGREIYEVAACGEGYQCTEQSPYSQKPA